MMFLHTAESKSSLGSPAAYQLPCNKQRECLAIFLIKKKKKEKPQTSEPRTTELLLSQSKKSQECFSPCSSPSDNHTTLFATGSLVTPGNVPWPTESKSPFKGSHEESNCCIYCLFITCCIYSTWNTASCPLYFVPQQITALNMWSCASFTLTLPSFPEDARETKTFQSCLLSPRPDLIPKGKKNVTCALQPALDSPCALWCAGVPSIPWWASHP